MLTTVFFFCYDMILPTRIVPHSRDVRPPKVLTPGRDVVRHTVGDVLQQRIIIVDNSVSNLEG